MSVDRGAYRARLGPHLAPRRVGERQETARQPSVDVRAPGSVDVGRSGDVAALGLVLVRGLDPGRARVRVPVGVRRRRMPTVIQEVRDLPGRRKDDRRHVGDEHDPARERADPAETGSGEPQIDLPGFR